MPNPRGAQIEAGALTPGRASTVTFDIPEDVVTEQVYVNRRRGDQMHPSSTTDVVRLASGVWSLKPVNDTALLHESATAHAYIMRLAQFNASAIVQEITYQRRLTELNGATPAGDVATSGDWFQTKRVPASGSWSAPLTSPGVLPALPTAHYPMERLAKGPISGVHAHNQGYIVKFIMAGTHLQNPDWVFGFQFGGQLVASATAGHTGYGLFEVMFSGDGRAKLFEWIDNAWVEVAEWRYNSPRDMPNAAVVMRIIPHFPGFIEFTSFTGGVDGSLVGQAAQTAIDVVKLATGDTSQIGTYVHEVNNRGSLATVGNTLRPVTGAGGVAVDVRQDLRCMWQVSRIAYPASGTLTDRPFTLPYGVGSQHILRLNPKAYHWFDGAAQMTGITAVAQSATGAALTPNTESFSFNGQTYTYSGWNPPGGQNACRAVFTFTNLEPAGARWHSPVLTGYAAVRQGHATTLSPAPLTGGIFRGFSATGESYDPESRTASLSVEDPTNALTLLRTRGQTSVRVESTYDPADPTKKVVLFEGYTGRVTSTLKGKRGMVYPSSNWRHLDCELLGKWDRLAGRFFHSRFDFTDDSESPSGRGADRPQPWKVTDIIRFVLGTEGWGPAQLDIFDDPIRVFSSAVNPSEDVYTPTPGTEVREYLKMLCRDFLNAFLVFDENAGSSGMWRLRRPPSGTETPLWAFVTTAPPGGARLEYRAGAYGANTAPILGPEPFETYIVRPEGNVLTVSGGTVRVPGRGVVRLQRTLVNRTSYDAPGLAYADPNNIDYLPTIKPIEYVDTTLETPQAVDFIARRVFNVACRGRKFCEFTAEMVYVSPGESVYTTRTRRPLMAGDTVTLDGDRWIVHGCNPAWEKDSVQRAHYELELFRYDNTFA